MPRRPLGKMELKTLLSYQMLDVRERKEGRRSDPPPVAAVYTFRCLVRYLLS